MGSRPWPLWSRDVIGHVIVRLAMGNFLLVVHCGHASVLHRYRDITIWSFSRKALPGREVGRRSVLNINIFHWFHILYFAMLGVKIDKVKQTPEVVQVFLFSAWLVKVRIVVVIKVMLIGVIGMILAFAADTEQRTLCHAVHLPGAGWCRGGASGLTWKRFIGVASDSHSVQLPAFSAEVWESVGRVKWHRPRLTWNHHLGYQIPRYSLVLTFTRMYCTTQYRNWWKIVDVDNFMH